MKRFAFISVLSVFMLAGCNLNNLIPKDDESKGGEEGESQESQEKGENLPYNAEEARNKLMDLGEESGVEIEFQVRDDEESEVEECTFGMKGNLVWQYSMEGKDVIKYENSVLTSYYYDEDEASYVSQGVFEDENAETYYNQIILAYTSMFYVANNYDGLDGYHKVKDLTFAGRSATEYRFDLAVMGAGEVHLETIVDKEIGITLYWDASGKSYEDGEGGSASFEVKSFKTGNQVNVPVVD